VRLASLEALVALTEVEDVSGLLGSVELGGMVLWRGCCLGEGGGGGVVRACAELIAGGVDGDVEGWVEDVPSLQVS